MSTQLAELVMLSRHACGDCSERYDIRLLGDITKIHLHNFAETHRRK